MLLEKLHILDVLLSLIYASIGIFIAYYIRKNNNEYYMRYMVPFMVFKIVCAYVFVLIHMYVYRGGDTFLYFAGSKFIANAIIDHPEETLNYLFGPLESFKKMIYSPQYFIVGSFRDSATLFQARLTTPFTLLSFNYFTSTTILISMFSAAGIWLIFKTMYKLYPILHKQLAIGVLFFPTAGIWTSGILKDTFTLFALGLIFYSVYRILTKGKYVWGLSMIILGTYTILGLKPYLLYLFLPAILIWYHSNTVNKIQSKTLRYVTTPILLTIIIGASFLVFQTISSQAGKYSLENVESIAVGFHEWHTYLAETRDQSGYTLGEVEFSLSGVISKAPQSIFVTFFRPLPFEVRNAAMALESFESSILLIITLYVIFKVGLFKTLKIAVQDINVRAFLIFALTFGIVVGFTSYNFGALSRYKVPCIPYYCAALSIIYYIGTKEKAMRAYSLSKKTFSTYSPKMKVEKQ